MTSCLTKNSKTIMSIDFTTDCPKRRAGTPCKYCYVECARNIGFNAKKVIPYLAYKGEVKKMKQAKIDSLNSTGGLRMFSFGDYMPEHDFDIEQLLDDCYSIGLKAKAITKQVDFVTKFVNHPAISVIHVSVDNVEQGVDWELAKSLRAQYPDKVRIRCVIMNDEDIAILDEKVGIDVFTFNHGRGLKQYGWKKYSKTEVQKRTPELGGRVCCFTGNCTTCELKCAVGGNA